jgi:hypothetical protein
MLKNQLESEFQNLGLPPERPRVLLSLPLVAVLTVDGPLLRSEEEAVCRFARHTLDFDAGQMQFLHRWLVSPPNSATVGDALQLLESLVVSEDAVTIENQTMETVLVECERLLRVRERNSLHQAREGRKLLHHFAARLRLDLGAAWQDVAPEVFLSGRDEDSPISRTQKTSGPTRRLRAAARLEGGNLPDSGGLV